jgi:dTMP kinase
VSHDGQDGVFVVLEGIDGAGTTTQAQRYAARLRARRRLVHVTNEPSGGPIGSLVRQVLRHRVTMPSGRQADAMALLFAADRLDHVGAEIEPLLRDGYVVISDRYDLSSLAYQATSASDDPAALRERVAWIRELNRHARRPDATLVLDVSAGAAEARRDARGGPRDLYEVSELQARLADVYRRAEELVPGDRVVHVDGEADVDAVTDAIEAALAPIVG